MTDALVAGQVLVVNDARIVRPEVVAYYRSRGHRVNTWGAGTSIPDWGIFDNSFDSSFN